MIYFEWRDTENQQFCRLYGGHVRLNSCYQHPQDRGQF